MKKRSPSSPASPPGGLDPITCLALLLLLAAIPLRAAAGPTGYLPVVGPAPLRLVRRLPPPPIATLPPLFLIDPPVAEQPAGDNPPPVPTPPHNAPEAAYSRPVLPTDATLAGFPATAAQEGTASAADPATLPEPVPWPPSVPAPPTAGAPLPPVAPLVTPQMLLQYFRPSGSNYLNGAWSIPVFVPPVPPPPPQSSATYRSP
jgi:hypothetical protein